MKQDNERLSFDDSTRKIILYCDESEKNDIIENVQTILFYCSDCDRPLNIKRKKIDIEDDKSVTASLYFNKCEFNKK